MRLKRPAASITVGEVVRQTETDFQQVECFNRETNSCYMDGSCGLKHAFGRALSAYLAELDTVTLAELVSAPLPDEAPLPPATARAGGARRGKASWRLSVAR